MSRVILGMTTSLDGFINDRNGSVGSLYPDLAGLRNTEPLKEAIEKTGAVVMGRNSFAMAKDPDFYAGNYEFQVPIFVVTHQAPKQRPKETSELTFTFVTDGVESAIEQAKAAAEDKEVTVIGGASIAQQVMKAKLADELQIDIMPVLLFGGLRPFDNIDMARLSLERLAVVELPGGRTHHRFRFAE